MVFKSCQGRLDEGKLPAVETVASFLCKYMRTVDNQRWCVAP